MARKFFKKMQNMENGVFTGVGKYNIPTLQGTKLEEFNSSTHWIDFHQTTKARQNRKAYSVHFFVDDYQFERCWSALGTYTKLLEQFNYVCTPDFSLYIDMPKAIQIYNHYRKHYLGAYWQSKGIKVLPTIAWSDKSSYDFCFDGEPKNSVVVTSTVGILSSDTSKRLFLDGYREMKERLNPSLVICYGRIPDGLLGDDRVINIPAFYEQTAKRCKMHDAVKKAFKS